MLVVFIYVYTPLASVIFREETRFMRYKVVFARNKCVCVCVCSVMCMLLFVCKVPVNVAISLRLFEFSTSNLQHAMGYILDNFCSGFVRKYLAHLIYEPTHLLTLKQYKMVCPYSRLLLMKNHEI